jgi:UDP-N-acetylglucosamine diphosphorylase/glucosamine-1-phosphate N-acetyltransferase
VVHPLSVIVGPAYLGPGTVVNPGAKLREGTSLGAHCKVGGEIEESIVLDLSNKQHDGLLGHAVVGSWVNLGADTNGSDLKNNYGPVRVDLGGGGEDTGSSFVGPHFGDHAKTGIDTMLTTGGVVGVAANVFGGGFAPRHVPSFSWGGSDGLGEYRLDAAVDTAKTVFARRGARWTQAHATLIELLFVAGAEDRRARGVA